MNAPIRRMRRMRTAFDCLESELRSLVAERKEFQTSLAESRTQPNSPVLADKASTSMSSTLSAFSTASGSSHFSSAASSASRLDLEEAEERSDLLHNLVKAAMLDKENGQEGMTDTEIVGNTYIYFL